MKPVPAAGRLASGIAVLFLAGCYYPYGYYPYGYYPAGGYYATVPDSATQQAIPVTPSDANAPPSQSAQPMVQGTDPMLVAAAPPVYPAPGYYPPYPAYPYYPPYPAYAPYPYYGWPAVSIGFGYWGGGHYGYWGGHGGYGYHRH
jgi:hypothetical protein